MEWKFYPSFNSIPGTQIYEILKLRQDVFILEQKCFYEDIDYTDLEAEHLLVSGKDELCGYLRIVPPGIKYREISIGRIAVKKSFRGQNLGRMLVNRALNEIQTRKSQPVRIEAQAHLISFYSDLGFSTDGAVYDLDGIPHVEMLYKK